VVIGIGPHGNINSDRGLFSRASGEISRSMLHLVISVCLYTPTHATDFADASRITR
jgi:hypothetical protein